MKGLEEFVCGKKLCEGLKLGQGKRGMKIYIPKQNDKNCVINNEYSGSVAISDPSHKYFVYKDMYRKGIPHLSTLDDMMLSVAMQWENYYSDYEDDFMTKVVLFSSDDPEEVLKWYIEDYLKLKYPTEDITEEEFVEMCERKYPRKPIKDSWDILYDFCMNIDVYKDTSMGYEEKIRDPKAMTDMVGDILGYA